MKNLFTQKQNLPIILFILLFMQSSLLGDEVVSTQNDSDFKDSYFISASFGASMMHENKTDEIGSIPLAQQLDDTGLNMSIGAGYYFTNDIFMTIGLDYLRYDDVQFYNYLLTLNKEFHIAYVNPYIGLVGGISNIKLRSLT